MVVMRIKLIFGSDTQLNREVSWDNPITSFPSLVYSRGRKWEFVVYELDPDLNVDFLCHFGEILSYHSLYNSTAYVDIDKKFGFDGESKCQCGAIHTSFPNGHMFFCSQWSPFQ